MFLQNSVCKTLMILPSYKLHVTCNNVLAPKKKLHLKILFVILEIYFRMCMNFAKTP